jgi:hypothetical protein
MLAKIGDTVTFAYYERDRNGKETKKHGNGKVVGESKFPNGPMYYYVKMNRKEYFTREITAIHSSKLKNPSEKLSYVAKYTSSPRSGAGKIAFTKKSSSLPTIRAISYPHEIAKSQMERYIGEHVAKIVKDSVKVAATTKNGKTLWFITIL